MEYVITLGGDGTILTAAKLFHENYLPPLISFSHGSLGYLCNFLVEEFESVFEKLMCCRNGKCLYLDNRLRLKASIPSNPMREIISGNDFKNTTKAKILNYHVMNEIVVDRGPSSYAI
jgi:NAD+ kinase